MTTIIIVNYNRLEYLKLCLNHIKQTKEKDIEIIIVDNGSDIETLKYLKQNAAIKLILNKKNMGAVVARNQGINIATGNNYLFLDNDALIPKHFFESINKILMKDESIGLIGPISNCVSGNQFDSSFFTNNDIADIENHSRNIRSKNLNAYQYDGRLVLFCLYVKGEVINKIGGFDTLFKLWGFEDDDYCLRALAAGFSVVIAKDLFVYHFGGQTFLQNDKIVGGNATPKVEYDELIKENKYKFFRKWKVPFINQIENTWDPIRLANNICSGKIYICPKEHVHLIDHNLKKIPTPNVATKGNLSHLQKLISDNADIGTIKKEYNKILTLRPFNPELHLQMIDYYLENNMDQEAISLLQQLINLTPEWPLIQKLFKSFEKSHGIIKKEYSFDPMTTLSICLIVKNEEKNIGRCLSSLSQIKNKEIIIVDTGSSDRTKIIAKQYQVKIIDHKWNNDFSDARNISMEYARGDWVLILDADEELAPNSFQNLKSDMMRPNIIGYRLPLENIGSPLHGVNYVPRLFRNSPGLYFIGKIHETIYASLIVAAEQWNMKQCIGSTKILHHGYQPDEIKIKDKIKRNLELYEDALTEFPDEPSIMMNYAHDLNHDGQTEKAYKIYKKIHGILEQHKTEEITPEVREQFIHNYAVFLAQEQKMEQLVDVMLSRTARDTGPVANVHYMAGLGLINCKRFKESIREFELCIEKAFDDTLAPSVPDIRSWRPRHLLANANASLGNQKEAIRFWEQVLVECDNSPDPFHDYARYLSSLKRNKEALDILIKSLDSGLNDQKIWELGSGIVNSDPELAEMAMDWTEEAVRYFPESDVTNVRRGEALMKHGLYLEAIPYFDRLTNRGERNATAAQLICKKMLDQLSTEDLEKVPLVQNELKGWTEIMDKAPGEFNRELAEQLIQ